MSEFNPYEAGATTEQEEPAPDVETRSIAGWLILPLLGLAFTLLRDAISIFTTFIPIFMEGTWDILTNPGSQQYDPLWGPLLIFEAIGTLGQIVLTLATLIYFINKSRTTPKLMIAFLLYNVAFVVGDEVIMHFMHYFDTHLNGASGSSLARAVIPALIWIPYFLRSQRVKETFVRNWSLKSMQSA